MLSSFMVIVAIYSGFHTVVMWFGSLANGYAHREHKRSCVDTCCDNISLNTFLYNLLDKLDQLYIVLKEYLHWIKWIHSKISLFYISGLYWKNTMFWGKKINNTLFVEIYKPIKTRHILTHLKLMCSYVNHKFSNYLFGKNTNFSWEFTR